MKLQSYVFVKFWTCSLTPTHKIPLSIIVLLTKTRNASRWKQETLIVENKKRFSLKARNASRWKQETLLVESKKRFSLKARNVTRWKQETLLVESKKCCSLKARNASRWKQETLLIEKIATICSTLASLWKCQYFRRLIYNPVEHLWWSFYCENGNPWTIFTKKAPS